MRRTAGLLMLLISLKGFSQDNSDSVKLSQPDVVKAEAPDYIWIFSSPRLINANTVELLPKGILAFSVTHNFGDVAGDDGGIKNFFGLDNATDVRIGFQYGVSKRLNLIAARAKGASLVQQQYEFGMKYRLLQQANDNRHPISMSLFANIVASAVKANALPEQDNSFSKFSDRLSEIVQLMLGRKFGKVSLQISPTMVNRNFVVSGDQNTLFALGGAMRLPVKGKFSLLVDYFHTFRSSDSKDFFRTQGIKFYDALGVGIEVVTAGHVFHMNFTNATEILENRFIPRTVTSWSKGQFRWGFAIARDFDLLWKKKHKQ